MNRIQFETTIRAPKAVVWEKLWEPESYREWTSAFAAGSYAESDWKEGSPIRFLTPGGNGMFGIIKKKVDGEAMSFEHQGEIRDGKEEPKPWAGATESYYLSESGGLTTLRAEMDTDPDFEAYFKETFPKAMAKLKEICEGAKRG